MWTLALLQVGETASWVGPTIAVSLAVIALCCLGLAGVLAALGLKLLREVQRVTPLAAEAQEEVQRTTTAVRELIAQGQEVVAIVRHEAAAYAQTGRRLRRKAVKGADRVEERLRDLEALYDVLYEEVADTSLDMAAVVRSARRGNGLVSRVRRVLVTGRR